MSRNTIRYFNIPNAQYRNKDELIRDYGYTIDKKLDEGGFGTIYLARDDRNNGTKVAVKCMDLGDSLNSELVTGKR